MKLKQFSLSKMAIFSSLVFFSKWCLQEFLCLTFLTKMLYYFRGISFSFNYYYSFVLDFRQTNVIIWLVFFLTSLSFSSTFSEPKQFFCDAVLLVTITNNLPLQLLRWGVFGLFAQKNYIEKVFIRIAAKKLLMVFEIKKRIRTISIELFVHCIFSTTFYVWFNAFCKCRTFFKYAYFDMQRIYMKSRDIFIMQINCHRVR